MSSKTFFCNKCKQDKEESEFWYDKRRGTVRTPCKECSNKQKRYVRSLNYLQNKITRSDILNHYRTEGLSEPAIDFVTDVLLLNRAIKSVQKPMVKNFDNFVVLFCPTCGDFDEVKLPCEIERFTQLLINYQKIHLHNEV